MRAFWIGLVVACASSQPAPPAAPTPATSAWDAPATTSTLPQTAEGTGATAGGTGAGSAHREPPRWIGLFFEAGSTRVLQVMDKSPAQQAGVAVGDRVLSIAGTPVTLSADVIREVNRHPTGSKVAVVVDRKGTQLTLSATLTPRPDAEELHRTQLLDKPAPDLALTTLDGKPLRLADFKGKVVMLDFWATWCGPCRMALPHLKRIVDTHTPKGLVVIGITDEDAVDVQPYVTDNKLVHTIALDPLRDSWRPYLVQGIPTTVLIDKTGVIRYTGIGFGGDETVLEAAIKLLMR